MILAASLALLLAMTRTPLWSQAEPGKAVTTEQLKKMLDSLGRKYTVNGDGDFSLNVARPGAKDVDYRCFLHSFPRGRAVVITCNGFQRGKDSVRLKVVAESDAMAVDELLQRINQWNINKSLSRAILSKGEDKAGKKICYARLEADLDWEIGVTEKKIDVLIKNFAASLVDFETFIGTDAK